MEEESLVIGGFMYIDTHCHLFKSDYEDVLSVIEENRKNGIGAIINCSCSLDSIDEALELSLKHEDIYLAIGYHPSEATLISDDDIFLLENIVLKNKKIVAIGEIGLDYHYGREDIVLQKKLFEKQLDLAEKLNLPVVIHTRDAIGDTIEILKRHNNFGVIHCFNGRLEVAKIFIDLGYKLGIGGVVTFKNCNLSSVLKNLSLTDIVLETDSPYLTPEPFRGKVNSSKYIPVIASKVAKIFNKDIIEVQNVTTATASILFDLF